MDDQRKDNSNPKRLLKGTTLNNYRPITWLPMMLKILMAQIREKIYYSLISRGIFPRNWKDAAREPETQRNYYIYRSTHPQREWNETEKSTYGLDWRQKGLRYGPLKLDTTLSKMYKIPDQAIQFIEKTMETWRVELTVGGKSFVEVKIQRGIFQGNALSPWCHSTTSLRNAQPDTNSVNRKKRSTIWCTWTASNFCQKRKRNGNLNTNCENILSRYRNGIWQRKIRHASNEKR